MTNLSESLLVKQMIIASEVLMMDALLNVTPVLVMTLKVTRKTFV